MSVYHTEKVEPMRRWTERCSFDQARTTQHVSVSRTMY